MATLGTIVSRMKNQLARNGHSKQTGLEALLYQFIHDALLDLAAEFPKAGEWRGRDTVTVSPSSSTATCAKTFTAIESVYNVTDDWPLVEWPEGELEATYGQNQAAGAPRYYSERGELTLELDVPVLVSTVLEVKGWVIPTERTSLDAGLEPDVGDLWHSLLRYMALVDAASHLQDYDLAAHYEKKATFYKHMFGRRIRRKLSEAGNIVQTQSEHLLSHRLNRRRRVLWD